jgi:hypothetical protein
MNFNSTIIRKHFWARAAASRRMLWLLILGITLFSALPAWSATLPNSKPPKVYSRWSALWRSALIPGWGQWYRGDRAWGAGYLGAVALSGGISYYYLTQGNSSYAAYQNATSASDATNLYNQTLSNDSLHQAFGYTAVGLYALNLADAALIGRVRSSKAGALLPGQAAVVADGRGGRMMVLRWEL